ncbi:MAG: thioredoxin domain-containing protein [Candidatus Moraniibacteriota bacterium]
MDEGVKEGVHGVSREHGNCGNCQEERGAWIVAGAVLLGALIVAASVLVSVKPKTGTLGTDATAPTAAQQPTQPGNTQVKSGVVSLDDDPILGNKSKAKVAIVEFSDYECPFCKQFHSTTYDQIVKDFVDTGKAVLSFRDYPLPFHEPVASKAAELANCVKEVKGDAGYFAFGKLYFTNTQANGKGLPEGKLDEILKQVGVNAASVNQCAASEKYKDEIAKDSSAGQAAGVSGTPSFVIGKLDAQGNVTGELVVGAQPYAQFKTTIEKYLQ